jgi:hypothetical protein
MTTKIMGPLWVYTVPPKTRLTIVDEGGTIQFQYTNDTFYIKWLDRPFYVKHLWYVLQESI